MSLDRESISALEQVEGLLMRATSMDHFCDNDNCTIETPVCDEMHARTALAKLQNYLEPPHQSLHPKRQSHDPERIFIEEWQKDNKRQSFLNHGFTLLEWILCPEGQAIPSRVTTRDAQVAASVVQWLGTSCGGSFLHEAERRVREACAKRSEWAPFLNHNREPPSEELATAELLAGPLKGKAGHHELVRSIAAALVAAKKSALEQALKAAIA